MSKSCDVILKSSCMCNLTEDLRNLMVLSSRNQGVRVELDANSRYHMLTSVENVVNPLISTVGTDFPLDIMHLIVSHHKSTYNMLTDIPC